MIPYIRITQLNIPSVPGSSINLVAEKGDIIGITGRNGSGKTSFAKFLAGEERPEAMGQILINGLDSFSQLDREKLRSIAGLVRQSPEEGMVLDNVGRDIAFGAENQGIPKEKTMKRTAFYLKKYSLSKRRNSPVSSLSASERQRVNLAGILIMHPDILVLDESFSMHGNSDTRKYLDVVLKSARKREQTVIIFSKNYDILKETDVVYELAGGSLREVDIEGFDYLYKTTAHKGLTIENYIVGDNQKNRAGISLRNVSFGYDDSLIIDRVNMRFVAGSAYRITGGHSTGKSAYLKLAAGLFKPFEGEVFRSENTKVGYAYQFPDEGFVESVVLDEVMFGPVSAGFSKKDARNMAKSVLRFVGLDSSIDSRRIHTLSFGEKKLVALAAAIALNPTFLLIDEPYAGLDMDSRKHIENILEGLTREGKCVVTVEA